jgi:hypothetical protein
LKEILNNDPEMAELYRETYQEIKNDKEYEEHEANRIDNKYKFLEDGEYKIDNIYNPELDLPEIQKSDEEAITTELSDTELDYVYKRYKLLQKETTNTAEEQM